MILSEVSELVKAGFTAEEIREMYKGGEPEPVAAGTETPEPEPAEPPKDQTPDGWDELKELFKKQREKIERLTLQVQGQRRKTTIIDNEPPDEAQNLIDIIGGRKRGKNK